MIVKFLSNKSGGGIGSVNYLLDQKRIENGTAKILRGDEDITRSLIQSMTKKQKTTFAVMSFEEANIPEDQKRELMDQFEKTFCAGLDKSQFNILWVEHTDKGRLELNCIIPKIELSTGKSFNPYFHGSDFHLADLFQNSANLKYGYSDPKDPAKQASVSGVKKIPKLYQDYKKLDLQLKELVAQGAIQDRSEMVELLKQNGIEVSRTGADYISVKLPESKKARRLNGGIYSVEFTSVDELRDIREEQAQRERAFASRDRQKEYGTVAKRLSDAVAKRAEYNAELFRGPAKRKRGTQETSGERSQGIEGLRETDNRSGQERPQEAPEARETIHMGHNQGEINDRARSAIIDYARSRKERARARAGRISSYAAINRQATATDYRAIAEAHRGRQLRSYIAESVKQLPAQLNGVLDGLLRSVHLHIDRVIEMMKPKEAKRAPLWNEQEIEASQPLFYRSR